MPQNRYGKIRQLCPDESTPMRVTHKDLRFQNNSIGIEISDTVCKLEEGLNETQYFYLPKNDTILNVTNRCDDDCEFNAVSIEEEIPLHGRYKILEFLDREEWERRTEKIKEDLRELHRFG